MEEESLESILAKADEIIQRTGGALNGEVEPEPEETTTSGAEETGSVAAAPATDSAAGSADDGQEVVKATPDLIRKVQQALTDAGLNPGVADGKLGPRSRGALIDFQKQHGLAEGKITKETLRELGIDPYTPRAHRTHEIAELAALLPAADAAGLEIEFFQRNV